MRLRFHNWMVFLLGCCLFFSCKKDEEPTEVTNEFGVVDAAFVGSWNGEVSGTYGSGDLKLTLNANGNGAAEGAGLYCRLNGKWGINDMEFKLRGSDCDGTVVTLVAPAKTDVLDGSWTASSGAAGSFIVRR